MNLQDIKTKRKMKLYITAIANKDKYKKRIRIARKSSNI